MSHYIDGFVLPIPRDRLDEYKRVVEAVAEVWKEHGALDYREYVGDDLVLEGTRSFTDFAAAGGWSLNLVKHVIWRMQKSRQTREWRV